MNNEENQLKYSILFNKYPDVVKVGDMKKMLPKTGKNKIYDLLRKKEIMSKRIGRDYYIPKINIIKFIKIY